MPIGLNSVANSVVLICPLPAVHRCLSVGLFAQCCLPPVPSIPPPPPFCRLCHSCMPFTFAYSPLPFLAGPSCGHCVMGPCHLQYNLCPTITFLFGKLAIVVCLVHLPCAAFCPLHLPQISNLTLDADALAARATCVGCVARRLKQAHTGRPTRITGTLNPPAMEAPMMPEWTMPG